MKPGPWPSDVASRHTQPKRHRATKPPGIIINNFNFHTKVLRVRVQFGVEAEYRAETYLKGTAERDTEAYTQNAPNT